MAMQMRIHPSGIVAFDLVGSALLSRNERLQFVAMFHDELTNRFGHEALLYRYGDGGVVIFPTCAAACECLQVLIEGWSAMRAPAFSPLLLGIRCAVHAGLDAKERLLARVAADRLPRHPVSGRPGYIPPEFRLALPRPVRAALQLAWSGRPDAVRISTYAANAANSALTMKVPVQHFDLRDGVRLEAHEVPLVRFLKPDCFRVDIVPPDDLIRLLKSNPRLLYDIPPRRFEEVVAELFHDLGYDVELTQQTRDRGIDLVAVRRTSSVPFDHRFLVQCKRNSARNRVGVEVVYSMLGVGTVEPHTGLVIATTSTFTRPARQLAELSSVQWRLHLKDYDVIRSMLERYGGTDG